MRAYMPLLAIIGVVLVACDQPPVAPARSNFVPTAPRIRASAPASVFTFSVDTVPGHFGRPEPFSADEAAVLDRLLAGERNETVRAALTSPVLVDPSGAITVRLVPATEGSARFELLRQLEVARFRHAADALRRPPT